MTKTEGKGVQTLLRIAAAAFKQTAEHEARSYVDGLTDMELGEVLVAKNAAARAAGETPNLLEESAAARLMGVDVEVFTSKPGASEGVRLTTERCSHYLTPVHGMCVRPAGHPLPHSPYPVVGEPSTEES